MDTKIYRCSSPLHKMTLHVPCAHSFEPTDSLPCLVTDSGHRLLCRCPDSSASLRLLIPHSGLGSCSLYFKVGRRRQHSNSQPGSVSSHKKTFRSKQTAFITSLNSTGILQGGGHLWESRAASQRRSKGNVNHPLKDLSPGFG